jgi:Rrf2 family protein
MAVSDTVSRKCKYALRAIFELSFRGSKEPVKIQTIARAQGIPARFLEVIMSELKHGGFVESKRGSDGGYKLARDANDITVGEVIAFMEGSKQTNLEEYPGSGNFAGGYVFSQMWKQVNSVVADIYNNTSFWELVEQEAAQRKSYIPNYAI